MFKDKGIQHIFIGDGKRQRMMNKFDGQTRARKIETFFFYKRKWGEITLLKVSSSSQLLLQRWVPSTISLCGCLFHRCSGILVWAISHFNTFWWWWLKLKANNILLLFFFWLFWLSKSCSWHGHFVPWTFCLITSLWTVPWPRQLHCRTLTVCQAR